MQLRFASNGTVACKIKLLLSLSSQCLPGTNLCMSKTKVKEWENECALPLIGSLLCSWNYVSKVYFIITAPKNSYTSTILYWNYTAIFHSSYQNQQHINYIVTLVGVSMLVPYLRHLVASLFPRRLMFIPRLFSVGFVVDKMVLVQGLLPIVWFLLSASFYHCFILVSHLSPTLCIVNSIINQDTCRQGCTNLWWLYVVEWRLIFWALSLKLASFSPSRSQEYWSGYLIFGKF
jgi:hypothetical protein